MSSTEFIRDAEFIREAEHDILMDSLRLVKKDLKQNKRGRLEVIFIGIVFLFLFFLSQYRGADNSWFIALLVFGFLWGVVLTLVVRTIHQDRIKIKEIQNDLIIRHNSYSL